MGGERPRANSNSRTPSRSPRPPSATPAPPFPSFLRRQEPTPPIHPSPLTHTPQSSPNSSLPPFRGRLGGGVGSPERPPAAERQPAPPKAHPHSRHPRTPLRHPRPLSRHPHASLPHSRAPIPSSPTSPPSFLRRQEPRTKQLSTPPPAAAITKAPHWCKVTTVNHTANLPTTAQRARRTAAALTRFGGGGDVNHSRSPSRSPRSCSHS